jgi:hypothetical protein
MSLAERKRRWLGAVAIATLICGAWSVYLNRDHCWLYQSGTAAILLFSIPWLWIALFLGLRFWGRFILILIALYTAVMLLGAESNTVAAKEALAVGYLRQAHQLAAKHREPRPTEVLPDSPILRYYALRFVALPAGDYSVEATPRHPECGCRRSFILTADGVIRYTLEPRPARISDPPLE